MLGEKKLLNKVSGNVFFSDNEKRVMEKLFLSINVNPTQIYILTYSDGDIIEAQVDTCYETDNGLDEDVPDYEEYHACAMRIVKIIVDKTQKLKEGSLIEINYHNYPQYIKDLQGNML